MNSRVAKSLTVATFTIAASYIAASADGRPSHATARAQTATYRSMDGFSRVVADKRFNGYFVAARGACSVSLIVSQADDEGLHTPVQRMQFELGATQVLDIAGSDQEALGVACGVDADALNVAKLTRERTRTVSRD